MTQIALYDYLGQINQFLENEQTSEAIRHCRYVLRQYPRHVDTYRLLARALLENREFEDAAELFRRILSADPNDFVAYVGLSEIYREGGKTAEAVWHMERAYEMSPYDPVVYEVLRDLYVQRDGGTLTEIPLTRAALARFYFKGELYQEAATELRTILQQNGDDRVDLEVLLSETLWRDNQRVDAVAVALKVLEKLPDSITVNAILGEVWLLTGRTEEAQGYLQHLFSLTQMDQKNLDPDSVVGQAFQTDGAPSLPKTIMVERWRTTADADRFDAGTRVGTEQPIEDEAVYDWLREDSGTDALGTHVKDEDESNWFTDRLEMPPDQEESFSKTAEWLESLGVEPESGDDFDFVADAVEDGPEADDEMLSLADEMMDWAEETADAPESDDFVQDWLSELDDTPVELVEEGEKRETDWFTSTLEDDSETEESDWFTSMEDEIEAMPETSDFHTADLLLKADEDDLDWLVEEEETTGIKDSQELSELAESLFADESLAGDDEGLPDWLLEVGESPESLDFGEPEDKFSLFGDMADSVGTGNLFDSDIGIEEDEEEEFDFDTASLLANANEDLPDWLTEEAPSAEERATGGLSDLLGSTDLLSDPDLPDWLSDEAEGEAEEPEAEQSGLIRRMNRTMDTDELFADEAADFESEEEVEEPESEPLGLTGLLLGTAELIDNEVSDDVTESEDEVLDADDPAEKAAATRFRGLLGTADLLADLDTEIPDWLQEGEDAKVNAETPFLHTADLQGENLDDVPHWLFGEEEAEEDKPRKEPSDATESGKIDTAELFASLGEDLPDWISDTDEEEAEERGAPIGGQSGLMGTAELLAEMDVDLPDWGNEKRETTGWQAPNEERDESLADVEEDDWLADETPMDEAVADIVEEATPPSKSLLDWLSGEQASSGERDFDVADEEELSDWLFSDLSQDEMEAVIMADNEQENNLEEMPDGSDDMDWLEELDAHDETPATGKRTSAEVEGEIPDWLSDLTEPATDSEAALSEADDVPLTLTDTDLPDWLKDLGESAPAKTSISGSMENLPDWLKPPPDLDLGSAEDNDLLEPIEANALPEFADDMVDENLEDLLDFDEADRSEEGDTSQVWLDALGDDEDAFDLESESIGADDEDLPDWLAMSSDDEAVMSETAETEEDEEGFDLWAESVEDDMGTDPDFDQVEAVASDWLTALMDDEGGLSETAAEDEDILDFLAEPAAESALDFDDLDAEEDESEALPDWLMESAADETMAAAETAEEQDLDSLEDDDMDWLSALAEEGEVSSGETADDEDLPDWLSVSAAEGAFDFEDEEGESEGESEQEDVLDLFAEVDTNLFDFGETADADEVSEEVEDVPDWLTATAGEDSDFEIGETADDLAEDEVEELPDWLADSALADEIEEMETAVTEDEADDLLPEFSLEADDDLALDDPMAWLEALAVEQDEPVEDLPSVLDTSMYDTITADQLTEISADDEDELPDDEEAAMARLEALAQEQEADLAEEMPLPIDIVNSPDSELLQMLELEAEEPVDLEEADLADELLAEDEEEEAALAWLDSLGEADDFEDLTTVVGPTADDALADLALETEEMSVDEVDLTLADMIVTDDEPTLDWLDALDESEAVLAEEMETAVTPTEDFLETVEVPDDLEEAMAWLDNLEAEEDEPFEAVPTLDELVSLEETIEAGETADTDEDEISWLTELAAQEEEAVEELLTVPEVEVEPEPPDPLQEALDQLEDLALQDSPSFMTADVSDSDESAEMESLDNVLDWLEAQLAAPTEEQTADELLETVEDSQDILEADTFIPDELSVDDDFVIPEEEEETAEESFLEDTFDFPDFEEEAAVEELPDLSDEMSDEMSDDDIMAFMNAILDDDDSFIPEKDVSFTPDDPDAIPSFAVSTQTVEEELVVEVEETADEPQLDEIHDFVEETAEADELADEMSDDDIMAFMDSIFDDDDSFVPEKDVSFTPDDPDAVPSFGASRSVVSKQPEESDTDEFVDVMASLAPEEDEADVLTGLYDDLSDDMSDDDILAFMDAVFDNDDSFVPEKDVSFNPDDPDAVPSFTTTRTAVDEPEEADFGDFSDEPDDAIAWLQDLVDAQEDSEDVEDLDSILPEIDEDFAVELFTDVSGVEETADTQDAMEFDETLADSLPDWLEFDGEERLSGHTDWLRSLPEPDVAGWLEAEEEVMASNIFDEILVPAEPEQSFSYTASYQDEVVSEPEPEMIEEEIEPDEEIPAVGVGLTTGILDSARQALAEGQYKQALNQYRNLVEEGQGLSTLIADLETATEEYPQPLLRRLLGDAYMRNGQLQRALETYRIALDEL